MYEDDFEVLLKLIEDFNPQWGVRKRVTGVDILLEAQEYKAQAREAKDIHEFARVVRSVLMLCQDGHTGLASPFWLNEPTFGEHFVYGPPSEFALAQTQAVAMTTLPSSPYPISYVEGDYRVPAELTEHEPLVAPGRTVTQCGGQDIHSYVAAQRSSTLLHWDWEHERFYSLDLASEPGMSEVSCEVSDVHGQLFEFKLGTQGSVKQPSQAPRPRAFAHLFEAQKLMYLRMPMMWPKTDWVGLIREASQGKTFERLAVDIRGNPGGSDLAWMNLVRATIAAPLHVKTRIVARNQPALLKHLGFEALDIWQPPWDASDEPELVVVDQTSTTLMPDDDSLRFERPVYILQDEKVFSAAGNLSWLALHSEQFISVGTSTGRLLGRGVEPRFFVLPTSGLIVGMELVMDVTDVTHPSEVYQDRAELVVAPTYEQARLRQATADPYDPDYLITHDPLIAALPQPPASQ